MASLFSDFLTALHVRHTVDYSDKRFYSMPFQSMFGLAKLLQEYGVDTKGVRATDKSVLSRLKIPFLADTNQGFAIVTSIGNDSVSYITQGQRQTAPLDSFTRAWNGIALLAHPSPSAIEPDYTSHRFVEICGYVKNYALWGLAVAILAYLIVTRHLYASWPHLATMVIDMAGVYISFMLVQKSLNIRNRRADAVCSVLEEGGCDTIAKSEAASFLGIVKWSEVGLAYFSVSLVALLIRPDLTPWLALCNVCCLPYTIWSIAYQKFVAKTWCTLCVTVQICLWLLFFSYLPTHWWHGIWPVDLQLFVLIAGYGLTLLAINRFDQALAKLLHPNNELIERNNDGTNYDSVEH